MSKTELAEQELAQAFTAAGSEEEKSPKTNAEKAKSTHDKKSPKLIVSIIVLVVGLIALISGIILFVLDLAKGPTISDGEFLLSASEWVLDNNKNCSSSEVNDKKDESTETNSEPTNCSPGVIWKFTEAGKGTLTTNNHLNDYDFIWAIEDGKLKIETKWLYDLNDEYGYELDKSGGVLTLSADGQEYIFVAQFENAE